MLVVLLAVSLWVLSFSKPRGAPHRLQQAWFIGRTNGAPNTFASTLPAHYRPFIREWLTSGTNVALFSITNNLRRSILLYPYVGFFDTTNDVRQRYATVLLNAPDAYGVFLHPGQAAQLEVAIVPRQGPGSVRFGYSPDYRHFNSRTTEELRGLITLGKRPDFHTEWFFSARIDP